MERVVGVFFADVDVDEGWGEKSVFVSRVRNVGMRWGYRKETVLVKGLLGGFARVSVLGALGGAVGRHGGGGRRRGHGKGEKRSVLGYD